MTSSAPVASSKAFGDPGKIPGDEITPAAIVDLLVHHAETLSLKGDGYRVRDRDLGRVTPAVSRPHRDTFSR